MLPEKEAYSVKSGNNEVHKIDLCFRRMIDDVEGINGFHELHDHQT
jgi:hypothetical protein